MYVMKVIEPSTTDQSTAFQVLVGLTLDVLALYSEEYVMAIGTESKNFCKGKN